MTKIGSNEILSQQKWVEKENNTAPGGTDYMWHIHTELGTISILDRLTGFGWRDIETGFRDITNGDFWLVSGDFDIRLIVSDTVTVKDAIELIKENANTCKPKQKG